MAVSASCLDDNKRVLPATASGLGLWLLPCGRGKKLLAAKVAAKVRNLAIAFGVESGFFIHGHAADGVFGPGF
jgi:hypothetical protein